VDRTEYLQTCQKCSVIDFSNIPEDLLASFEGVKYIPYGYEIKFKEGKPIHNAILRDVNAHSVVYADLSKVDKLSNV
jgi:hypothetical protein